MKLLHPVVEKVKNAKETRTKSYMFGCVSQEYTGKLTILLLSPG
jgi:hypothetical protein